MTCRTSLLLCSLFALVATAGCGVGRPAAASEQEARHEATAYAARHEVVPQPDFRRGEPIATDLFPVRLERITTAVPWPRGLAWVDDKLIVLARGRHRRAGGVSAEVEDMAGCLFEVDPAVSEPVVIGEPSSAAVQTNGRPVVRPSAPPFHLWDRETEPVRDNLMDRPYCTLAYDAASENFFICGYSGVDLPGAKFRKNATDTIHRFDRRTGRWSVVEHHRADVVPEGDLGYVVPNDFYPHHDPVEHAPPHGWLNGANGAIVAGRYLYAAAKDNHCIVQYDLAEIRANPDAPPPPSRRVFGSLIDLSVEGKVQPLAVYGHSAAAVHDGYLYVGFRTSSLVVRFPLTPDGDVAEPAVAELIAAFQPWDPEAGKSGNLIDLRFNSRGELFVSCAGRGRVWKIGVPDPTRIFDGDDSRPEGCPNQPYADLRELTGNGKARCGNIVFDDRDRLYVCSGNYDSGTEIAGVVYRVVPADG